MVAQEHLTSGLFSLLFNLAAQVARSIGLHQWEYSTGQFSLEDTQQRQNVSYCLYVLDKAVCWTTGGSPGISQFDVTIEPALTLPLDEAATYLVAKAKMARIEEQIYWEIYSSQSRTKTEDQISQIVSMLDLRLQDWSAESGVDLEDSKDCDTFLFCSRIELSIAFYSTRILLIWPFDMHPDVNWHPIDDARKCMRLLLRLWSATSELGHYATLAR